MTTKFNKSRPSNRSWYSLRAAVLSVGKIRRFELDVADDVDISCRRELGAGDTPCLGVTLGESTVDLVAAFFGETLRSSLSLIFNDAIRDGNVSIGFRRTGVPKKKKVMLLYYGCETFS